MRQTLLRIASEPLVQFLILGALVFAIDLYVLGAKDDPRRILVDDARFQEIASVFEENQGRPPTEDEIGDLIVKWTQNEILYREALTMGLDQGDEMIRSRMVLKLRDVLFNNVIIEAPSDEVLEAWFAEHRANYDRPEFIDFEQFLVSDLESEAAAELAAMLGDDQHPEQYARDFRRYAKRIDDNLLAVFKDADAERLIDAPAGQWVAVESDLGWHLARITTRYPGVEAEFDVVRTAVVRDWREAARKQELAESLSEIVALYDVSYEFTVDVVEQSLASVDSEFDLSPQ